MTVTTFSFTTGATVSSWTVPNHTGTLTIEARGGAGGPVPSAVGGAWAGGGVVHTWRFTLDTLNGS